MRVLRKRNGGLMIIADKINFLKKRKQKTIILALIGWWYFGAGLWIKLQPDTPTM